MRGREEEVHAGRKALDVLDCRGTTGDKMRVVANGPSCKPSKDGRQSGPGHCQEGWRDVSTPRGSFD